MTHNSPSLASSPLCTPRTPCFPGFFSYFSNCYFSISSVTPFPPELRTKMSITWSWVLIFPHIISLGFKYHLYDMMMIPNEFLQPYPSPGFNYHLHDDNTNIISSAFGISNYYLISPLRCPLSKSK